MIRIRPSASIHVAKGTIQKGTFTGRWHFSFDEYFDPKFMNFGPLRVFNDDTLSPGAVWPLHPHRNIEVVTYCAGGVFRHEDEHGKGGVLEKGWVQHTSVGRGMHHSEINDRKDLAMRFIQLWFLPWTPDLEPEVQQMKVLEKDRTNRWYPLVSNTDKDALPIFSDARVYSSHLKQRESLSHQFGTDWGGYLYVLEGGPVRVEGQILNALDAAMISDQSETKIVGVEDAELLLIDALLRSKLMRELS